MNALTSHNVATRELLLTSDRAQFQSLVDLDNIDSVLRGLLTIEEMREAGSFFTGQELAERALSRLSAITSSSIVLDPTCGSGSSAIACKKQLREYIGYEKDKKIYDIALERYDRET